MAFIGFIVAGLPGATAAALGIFLPIYLVVVPLAPSYQRWAKNSQLNALVRGVTAAATGAIAGAVIVLARRSIYDLPTFAIAIVSLAVLFRCRVPEPVVIACTAMAGLLLRPTWTFGLVKVAAFGSAPIRNLSGAVKISQYSIAHTSARRV